MGYQDRRDAIDREANLLIAFTGGAATSTGGENLEANGSAADGASAAAFSQLTEMVVGFDGELAVLMVNSAAGDATTVMNVNVNGSLAEAVTLAGASDTVALARFALVAGDTVTVAFASGQNPGALNAQVLMRAQ